MRWFSGRPVRRQSPIRTLKVEQFEARCVPSFLGNVSLDANGTAPQAVAVAQLTDSGFSDLIVANSGSNNVSVLLGNGDGTFRPARTFAVEAHPTAVAVGDFNGDGIPDIVVANTFSNDLTILIGTGNGFFEPGRPLPAGNSPDALAVGDFNGDGNLDIAVANANSNTVSILLGTGDGYFQFPQDTSVGRSPRALVAADFNGDGNLDLAVANGGDNSVSVLLGNGDATFHVGSTRAVGTLPEALVAADFNGDGNLDLATANAGTGTNNVGVSVLLGNGDGSFGTALNAAIGTSPQSLAVGDFNGDGILDLVTANPSTNQVNLLWGNGDGTFQTGQPSDQLIAGTTPQAVAVGDFNGDGAADLAVANRDGNNVSILLGNGDGTFPATPSVAAGIQPTQVVAGHFFGDNNPVDLAVLNFTPDANDTVSLLIGNGDGTFQPQPITIALGIRAWSLAAADFNGDGNLDLAVTDTTDNAVLVFLGNGNGTFKPAQSFFAGQQPHALVVGDFNNDGLPDLAVADFNGSSNTTISILLGNRDNMDPPVWRFLSPVLVPAGIQPQALGVGDFNGDGKLDLAVARGTASGNFSVLLGNGNGTFRTGQTLTLGTFPTGLVVGDFNNDGVADVAVVDSHSNNVSVLLGNGDGSFQIGAILTNVGNQPQQITAGDFDQDGNLDLAVVSAGGVKVLLGNGDGTFKPNPLNYIVGMNPMSLAVADLNNDGYQDLAVANEGSDSVSILLNDATWPTGPGAAAPAPARGERAAASAYPAESRTGTTGAAVSTRDDQSQPHHKPDWPSALRLRDQALLTLATDHKRPTDSAFIAPFLRPESWWMDLDEAAWR